MTKRFTTLMSASALTLTMFAVQPALADFTVQFGSDQPANTHYQKQQRRDDVQDARQDAKRDIRDARQDGKREIRDARQNPYLTNGQRREAVQDAKRDMKRDVQDAKRDRSQEVREAARPGWKRPNDNSGVTIQFN